MMKDEKKIVLYEDYISVLFLETQMLNNNSMFSSNTLRAC